MKIDNDIISIALVAIGVIMSNIAGDHMGLYTIACVGALVGWLIK